jgi:hypothetical protein
MHPALQAYEASVDDICGTFARLCLSLPGQQQHLQRLASEHGIPLESTLTTVTFGNAPAPPVHTATFGAQIYALKDGGHDEVLVGNVCAAYIYSLWEDKYRGEVAVARGILKNEVRSELFRELGTYRHAIIHNQSLGTSKTASLVLLPAVPKDNPVRVTRHVFELIALKVKAELVVT